MGLSPARRLWTIVMIVVVLGLTLYVYKAFEIGDVWVWLGDVLILAFIMGLVFLAAFLFVWLLMLYRKHR